MDDLPNRITRRMSQLEAQREPHVSVWRDVFDYIAPERSAGWWDGNYIAATTAAAQRASLMDGTAIDAMEVLKSTYASGMTPENSRWFAYDAGQEDEDSVRWMDGAAEFVFEHINAAGFASVSSECYSDLLPAGWFVLYIDEAKDEQGRVIGGFNFESWPLHQCYVACSRAGGRVDTIYRRFFPTVEQLVTEYTLEKCSQSTQRLYAAGNMDQTVEVIWSIEPQRGGNGLLAKNKPFRSVHLERSQKHILRQSGYDEFPCAVPRWRMIPGTAYATGIGSNVLPDVKTLNQIVKLELMSLDIALGGMWKAKDDGVLNPRTTKIGARRIVMVAEMENFAPLQTGMDFKVGFTKQERLQQSIRRALLADMLTPQGGPVRSALEIARDMNQIRQMLGPMLGRQQAEYLQVLVERCFNIAFRAGALVAQLGPVPEALAQGSFNVRYISPLARSQKMEEVTAIDQHLAGLAALAPLVPTALDGLKIDDAMYQKGLALGVPANLLRGPKELVKKRETDNANNQAAQQQVQQEQLQQKAGEAAIDAGARTAAA